MIPIEKNPKLQLNAYWWLDLLRGMAAMLVVIGHLRSLLFLPYHVTTSHFGKVFYFFTGFAHEAVVIFFVLSGFFITKSIHTSYVGSGWSLVDYSVNRLLRLWIVLLPSLIVTLILDRLGLYFFPDSAAYSGSIQSMPDISPIGRSDMLTMFGNLFYLQTIVVKTFGTNPALWSLANEFWYYVIFPLMFFAIAGKRNRLRSFWLILAAAVIFVFVGLQISLDYLIWITGSAAYFIHLEKGSVFNDRRQVWPAFMLFSVWLVFIRVGKFPLVFNDHTLGVVTGWLVIALVDNQFRHPLLEKFSDFIARISFSVYLFHLSFIVIMASWLCPSPGPITGKGILMYFAILSAAVVYCYCFYLLFESRTNQLKQWLKKKLPSERRS